MEYALLFLPLIGSIFTGFFSKIVGEKISIIISCLLITASAILSIFLFYQVISLNYENNLLIFNWITSGSLNVNWSIKVDALSSIMLVVVCFVSSLVHIYSVGYMSQDPHKPRFISYLSLFTFSMLVLVTSDNFIQLFFGWEGVGLCSYFLIGFWYKKNSANAAAMKAFIVNRVGDFGLALGIFLIFYLLDTVNYNEVFSNISNLQNSEINFIGLNINSITLISVLLFIGAMGKSAQFLLHTWLPDAMEGPTPVSALIHAATMVTAGVFLVARCSPIFEYSSVALDFVLIIGMLTAFFAATVALVQKDIKKIIAYSTCSQLGYMFIATGIGAYHVAIFHLFTHAFFKALLFLGAGSVIHSLGNEQDLDKMGGLWKKMPYTWILMIIGTLALTGFPLLSGYYSKDAIIEFAYLRGNSLAYLSVAMGIITAILTSIYSWRLIFKTFHGSYNNNDFLYENIKESPTSMMLPLILLSLGSIFAGFIFKELFIGYYSYESFWKSSIFFLSEISKDHPPFWILIITPLLVTIMIPVSYYLFILNKNIPKYLVDENKNIYNFLVNKWYFDEIYEYIFIKPLKKLGNFLWKIVDLKTIDRFGPDGISNFVKFLSTKAVKFQSGYIYHYAFVMLIGVSILLTYLMVY